MIVTELIRDDEVLGVCSTALEMRKSLGVQHNQSVSLGKGGAPVVIGADWPVIKKRKQSRFRLAIAPPLRVRAKRIGE